MTLQFDARHVHMVGIGGVGMSALAHALYDHGITVTGSDIAASERVTSLRQMGIDIHIGHASSHIGSAELLVHTSAVRPDNPELAAARERGIAIWHRSELLAHFLRSKRGLAIAGTHGKTTTTAMVGKVLTDAGCDPTIFLGGISLDFGSNYRLGQSELVVVEADESDASFHHYTGCSQIITNVEPDHLDQHHDFATVRGVFERFIAIGDPDGFLVYGADSPALSRAARECPGVARSFSLRYPGAGYYARPLRSTGCTNEYRLLIDGIDVCDLTMPIPGSHIIADALAAIGMAHMLGVAPGDAAESLRTFAGTGRRFELVYSDAGLRLYDDYAHHPTEIRAALQTARLANPDAHVTAVFQPHLPSRTRFLLDDFARAFGDADSIVLTEIYAAREDPIPVFSSQALADRIGLVARDKELCYIAGRDELIELMLRRMPHEQVVVFIGAGDINGVSRQLAERLNGDGSRRREESTCEDT